MRRKWMAALCVASLSMAMMTGCGNGSTQETAKETQTETQTQAETQSETQTETASETEKATETESETAKAEKAAETEVKEKTMYVSGDVYMREAADKDAKAVTVLATGKEITVLGEEGDWYQVKVDDKEGYVVKKYITDSKEEAEAAAKAKQDAEEAAAAQQAFEAFPLTLGQEDGSSSDYGFLAYFAADSWIQDQEQIEVLIEKDGTWILVGTQSL